MKKNHKIGWSLLLVSMAMYIATYLLVVGHFFVLCHITLVVATLFAMVGGITLVELSE